MGLLRRDSLRQGTYCGWERSDRAGIWDCPESTPNRNDKTLENNMPETEISISSGDITLEARLDDAAGVDMVVLCHPHPLYGGNMDNNVVWTLKKTLRAFGWSTLRYNSRGVGRSGGFYGDGEGETQDLLAVLNYVMQKRNRILHLAGYSYGAWVGLKAVASGFSPASLILVSPPLDFISFQGLAVPHVPCLITLGTKDEFCRVSSLDDWLALLNLPGEILTVEKIPRCDHFYRGWESTLASAVETFLRDHT